MRMIDDFLDRFIKSKRSPEKALDSWTEEDWNAFHTTARLPEEASDHMQGIIDRAIAVKKVRRLTLRWSSAAAAVLVLGLAGWKWSQNSNSQKTGDQAIVAAGQSTAPARRWQEKFNHTHKTILLILPDNSKVELASNSSIKMEEGFTKEARSIYLKGKAQFDVAPDKTRPFTVYAGGLATTALGTRFTVTSWGDSADKKATANPSAAAARANLSSIEIELHSGKILVSPDSLLKSQGVKDTYLNPGQQLRFDPEKLTVMVIRQSVQPAAKPADPIDHFDNLPLKSIFASLEKEYHCQFNYTDKSIESIRFTGSFNSNKETVDDLISTIALLNNLTLSKKNNTFYLK